MPRAGAPGLPTPEFPDVPSPLVPVYQAGSQIVVPPLFAWLSAAVVASLSESCTHRCSSVRAAPATARTRSTLQHPSVLPDTAFTHRTCALVLSACPSR